MKKEYRVKKNEDFSLVFKEGKSVANRQFVLYMLPKAGQAHFRIGFSVSKKLGNAVVRNRIKRLMRQCVFLLQDDIKPTNDYVLIARQPCLEQSLEEMKKSISHVFYRGYSLKGKGE